MSRKDHDLAMPAAYLKVFLQHAAAENLPPEKLLEGTGLTVSELIESDRAIGFGDTRRVLANGTRILGPGWHLSLAARLNTPAHGPVGFAVVTAPDLRAAVNVLLRYIGIRGPFLWSAGAIEGDQFVIRFFENTDMEEARGALIELALLSVQGMLERPLGRELHGGKVSLAYPAPVYADRLESAFHMQLVFDARGHSLRFPATWLDEPCMMFDPAMHRYLVNRCEEEIQVSAGSLPAEIAVRQALLAQPGILPSLSEIAASRHMSARTLIRRLRAGNTSYQAIVENVRKTLAADYLLNSDMKINGIAYRLGYKDPSNFGRAFRGWFNTSPGRFRARQTK